MTCQYEEVLMQSRPLFRQKVYLTGNAVNLKPYTIHRLMNGRNNYELKEKKKKECKYTKKDSIAFKAYLNH